MMNNVHYNPFHDLLGLQNRLHRQLATNLSRTFADEGIAPGTWTPSLDLYENKGQIVLDVEMPGMKRGDFDLTIEHNVLTLRGERRFPKNDEADTYHRMERSYGTFSRSFTLPQTILAEGIRADYENGVLHVTLAKREELKARRIEINGRNRESKTTPTIEALAADIIDTKEGQTKAATT